MKPSFTLLELVIVIILIGILAATISISIPNDKLQTATDTLIKYIDYTHSLALKDDKYQVFSKNKSNLSDNNLAHYWYKKWWRISIGVNNKGNYYFEVYTDMNLNGNDEVNETAKDPLTGKYLKGNYSVNTASKDTNLSRFGIKKIIYKYENKEKNITTSNRLNIYFDNYGNVFKKLYNTQIFKKTSTLGSNILSSNLEIKLCIDSTCDNNKTCKAIVITPTGYTYKSTCY